MFKRSLLLIAIKRLAFLATTLVLVTPAHALSCKPKNFRVYLHCKDGVCGTGFVIAQVFSGRLCDQISEIWNANATYIEFTRNALVGGGISKLDGTYGVEFQSCIDILAKHPQATAFDDCRKPIQIFEKKSGDSEANFSLIRNDWQKVADSEKWKAMLSHWGGAILFSLLVCLVLLSKKWIEKLYPKWSGTRLGTLFALRIVVLAILFCFGFMSYASDSTGGFGPHGYVALIVAATLAIPVYGLISWLLRAVGFRK